MDKNKNYLQLKKFALAQGLDLFGVAGIEAIKDEFMLSKEVLGKIDNAVSLGIRLSGGLLQEIENAPTRLYFHHYRTANAILDQIAFRVSWFIQNKGFLAVAIPASQILDWQNQKAHLSHKKIAQLAGLGWTGRNNLLVNKKYGCQLRLVTILTDMPLKLDEPSKDNCADCRLCIEVCPAGAIREKPEEFDHLGCFEKLKEFQKRRLVDQFICGVCVNACRGRKEKK
ncbi:MAG: 4Fe-4S binding protein [Candidatus Omnitrophica bacterium]|nr:4Fe-4S binding protein [Candidatus Omnitrophota bacterium]